MRVIYKEESKQPVEKQSDHDALKEMFECWSAQYSQIMLDVIELKLNDYDTAIKDDVLEQVIIGTDTVLDMLLVITNAILYDRLKLKHKELDILIKKKDMRAESFNETYLNIRRGSK